MFNIKLKIKEARNSLPRSINSSPSNSLNRIRRHSCGNNSNTNSLRSSLSNKSPYSSLRRKDKKVRIITTREKDKDLGEIISFIYIITIETRNIYSFII